jgi:hypothetical protein
MNEELSLNPVPLASPSESYFLPVLELPALWIRYQHEKCISTARILGLVCLDVPVWHNVSIHRMSVGLGIYFYVTSICKHALCHQFLQVGQRHRPWRNYFPKAKTVSALAVISSQFAFLYTIRLLVHQIRRHGNRFLRDAGVPNHVDLAHALAIHGLL